MKINEDYMPKTYMIICLKYLHSTQEEALNKWYSCFLLLIRGQCGGSFTTELNRRLSPEPPSQHSTGKVYTHQKYNKSGTQNSFQRKVLGLGDQKTK
jgi:hypothetical protein